MRTTLRLDDGLLKEAKRLALETGKTLGEVIEELLREALARRRQAGPLLRPAPLPLFRGGGLQPGVDLDDSAGLLDLMEGR
ncbi:MAG TPA: type II toxin-antitoxin system VapB family antitoxin [Planctomycetota bacterium]